MSELLPVVVEQPRDLIVCFGFDLAKRRRQPWHVAHGLAQGLAARGRAVTIATDVAAEDDRSADYIVHGCGRLMQRGRPTPALRRFAEALAPARIYILTGTAALARMARLDLGAPTELIVASPLLRLREILAVGPLELWRERRLMLLPLVNALLPGCLVRAGYRRSGAVRPIYLSEAGRERFRAIGLPPGPVLRPQVEAPPIMLRPRLLAPEAVPVVAYLGPPLALRGAHLALGAFEAAVARGLDARLLLLLRPDVPPAVMRRFVERVARSPAGGRIEVTTEMLGVAELARAIAGVDVFLLPFQAPVSEVPLVVIEAGLTGRPVITLEAPGVSEQVLALGGFVARTPEELPHALIRALRQRQDMLAVDPGSWTSWPRAVSAMLDAPVPPSLPQRLIALCGVDGTGKSFLCEHLRRHFAEAGIANRHVWSRFRNYLSKPLLALARLTGHNYKVETGGVRIGYHDFVGRPWLVWPFLALQAVDQVLDIFWRYHLGRREPILGDRCVLDTLVDLAIDTGLDDVVIDRLGPLLVALLPRPRLVVLIERHPLRIQEQRPDALLDRHFHRRRLLYRRLAERFDLPVVDNNGPVARTLEAILALVQEQNSGIGAGMAPTAAAERTGQ
jgi:glycosyltransferase involved in cell wall biosynthesis/thymidylate kinase